jgi:acetyltransferase-like isoleucine patch superfamily enzyme
MDDQKMRRVSFEEVEQWKRADRQPRAARLALLQRYNNLPIDAADEERRALLREIFGEAEDVFIIPPLISGGKNVRLGRRVGIHGSVNFAGMSPITIGPYTLIGQNVQLLTDTHPTDPTERQQWAFWSSPISIGQNVFIGANAIIGGGVTIGDHSVIGAGSVVTRDVPACTFVAGNPARVIRQLTPPDMATLYDAHEAARARTT